jgi:hypothetical protein
MGHYTKSQITFITQREIEKFRGFILERRKEMLKDPRIDELIKNVEEEIKGISKTALLFIGRYLEPAGIPTDPDVAREKACYIL